jgi:UDP-N-acetylmuramoyl-tripeptide--D-alanyl-D-alanine ligase
MAVDIKYCGFGLTDFTLVMPSGAARVRFPLNGKHNILNALAASSVGHSFGMTVAEIGASLSNVTAPPQRGEVLRFAEGFTVINDSYNSNPDALLSMVSTLLEGASGTERKIVVAGEMLELGPDAANIHRRTGESIAASGVDVVIGVRGFGRDIIEGAAATGKVETAFADSSDVAGELLAEMVRPGDVVLVKGSRGVRTEKVIEKLLEKFELEANGRAAA